MQRMGMVIGIAPERIAEYKTLHAAVWPQVLARLAAAHVSNYSIFLREPENLLFGYWEYHGEDFAGRHGGHCRRPGNAALVDLLRTVPGAAGFARRGRALGDDGAGIPRQLAKIRGQTRRV